MELERLASIFEAVRVMPLRPGDLLVFRASTTLSIEDKARAHAALEEATGHPRILILDDGADLAVLRPEPDPEELEVPPAAAAPAGPVPVKRGSAPGAIA